MSPMDDRGAGEIASALVAALEPALLEAPAPGSLSRARAAAGLLGLQGLDRLLAACEPYAERAWAAPVLPAIERLRRVVESARRAGSLGPFRESDRELAGLAGEVEALGPAFPPEAVAEAGTVGASEALEGVPLAAGAAEIAERARLEPPVAAALRAALDWLLAETRRPIALRVDGSALEARCERVDGEGLAPAAAILARVGGNLGPVAAGGWTVRVALHDPSPTYLMLLRGGLRLAIPWHAVLRLHIARGGEIAGEGAPGGWPVLPGLEPPAEGAEVPLALIAHGGRRAWLPAERLVWRLRAHAVEPGAPAPAPGLAGEVETDEGERYWVADPGWLLRDAGLPAPAGVAEPPAAPPEMAVLGPGDVAPLEAPADEPLPVREAGPEAPAAEIELEAEPGVETEDEVEAEAGVEPEIVAGVEADIEERVEPQGEVRAEPEAGTAPGAEGPAGWPEPRAAADAVAEPAPREPAPREPHGPGAAPEPRPGPPEPRETPEQPISVGAARRALVAEDSITARIFLARSLSRLGFEVRAVETAAALRDELERASWSLVFVDVELPDESGAEFVSALVARHGGRTPFVALVRDADDRAAARRAGLDRTLRKPFDESELRHLLERLGALWRP